MQVVKVSVDGVFYYVFLDKDLEIIRHVSKFFNALQSRNVRYSQKTIKQYASTIKYFLIYIEQRFQTKVDLSLESIDGLVINEYLKVLKDQGISAATIRSREVAIKNLLTWLTTTEAGRIREDNGYGIEKYKSPKPLRIVPKYLLLEEVIEFINLLHDENYRCLIHFMVDSGLRVSEIGRVKKSDLPNLSDYPDDTMYFDLKVKGSKGRGGAIKERITFITRAVLLRLTRLHNQHSLYRKHRSKYTDEMPLFLNVKGNPMTSEGIQNLIYKTAKRGGLKPKKYSSHKFRHTFAMSVLMSEFDKEFLNKLVILKGALGHESIKTTEMYTLIPPAVIKNLQNKNKKHNIVYRFEEAQFIYDSTYLAKKNHTEKRGR